jgi:hypothetical protein
VGVKMAVLMPITRPPESMSGPPLLPGLMLASHCMPPPADISPLNHDPPDSQPAHPCIYAYSFGTCQAACRAFSEGCTCATPMMTPAAEAISRPRPDTTPVVSVWSNPNGFPATRVPSSFLCSPQKLFQLPCNMHLPCIRLFERGDHVPHLSQAPAARL